MIAVVAQPRSSVLHPARRLLCVYMMFDYCCKRRLKTSPARSWSFRSPYGLYGLFGFFRWLFFMLLPDTYIVDILVVGCWDINNVQLLDSLLEDLWVIAICTLEIVMDDFTSTPKSRLWGSSPMVAGFVLNLILFYIRWICHDASTTSASSAMVYHSLIL